MTGPRVLAIGTPPGFRQQVARAMSTSDENVDWLPSVMAAEETLVVQHMSPHVLVLSPEIKDADALGVADFIAKSSPTTAVVLLRTSATTGLMAAAMRAGVREVVDVAAGAGAELGDALDRAVKWSMGLQAANHNGAMPSGARGKIVSIFSSKGGVGKTFLAANVAAAISAKSGKDTALVDFDLKVGDVFSYFGQEPARPVADLVALRDETEREGILHPATQLKETLWAYGALPDPASEPMAGETAGKVLRAMRSTFDYTIVDASNDYSDQTVGVFDLSDEIWLVTGLDVVGMRHLLIAMETLDNLGIPNDRWRVVLNRADSQVGPSLADVERVLKVRIDMTIPSSELVPRSLNKGVPVYFSDPESDVAQSIDKIADGFLGETLPMPQPASVGRKRFRLLFGLSS